MNYIKHLTGFYSLIQDDDRLNPTHISLYLALFQFWNINHFRNPISVSRNELMRLCKISAFATYHKCIKELQAFGYIRYMPSFNPYKGSLVHLYSFDGSNVDSDKHIKNQTANEELINNKHIKKLTASSQALVASINNTNSTNNTKGLSQTQDFNFNEVRGSDKNDSLTCKDSEGFKIPDWPELRLYFEEKEAKLEEAEKFYNHYESNGWLVGGKAKMKNWQAAARNWLLNAKKFDNTPVQKIDKLHATTQKNYTDPL